MDQNDMKYRVTLSTFHSFLDRNEFLCQQLKYETIRYGPIPTFKQLFNNLVEMEKCLHNLIYQKNVPIKFIKKSTKSIIHNNNQHHHTAGHHNNNSRNNHKFNEMKSNNAVKLCPLDVPLELIHSTMTFFYQHERNSYRHTPREYGTINSNNNNNNIVVNNNNSNYQNPLNHHHQPLEKQQEEEEEEDKIQLYSTTPNNSEIQNPEKIINSPSLPTTTTAGTLTKITTTTTTTNTTTSSTPTTTKTPSTLSSSSSLLFIDSMKMCIFKDGLRKKANIRTIIRGTLINIQQMELLTKILLYLCLQLKEKVNKNHDNDVNNTTLSSTTTTTTIILFASNLSNIEILQECQKIMNIIILVGEKLNYFICELDERRTISNFANLLSKDKISSWIRKINNEYKTSWRK